MRSSTGEDIAGLILSGGEDFSIYLHIPFCAAKCPYCSFYSFVPSEGEVESYCSLLAREIDFYGELLKGGGVRAATFYFGGGTPTLLAPDRWRGLLTRLGELIPQSEGMEISVEANPDSLLEEHLSAWREHGVTRVSVGVQSLSDDELVLLERLHDSKKAEHAVRMCVDEGFSVSADLIFGLPGQSLRSFAKSVEGVVSLGVDHLSLYQLTVDEGCRWSEQREPGPADGYGFYRWAQWRMPKYGFSQYEIASFARPGRECRHNMAYWTNGQVLALGAGAWGCADGLRYRNERTAAGYAAAIVATGNAVSAMEPLDAEGRAREAAILLLRTSRGIVYDEFISRHGEDSLAEILAVLRQEVPPECLIQGESSLTLSPRGMRVANAIWRLIVQPSPVRGRGFCPRQEAPR
ncbi:MAG: radical SAM family heme chaperone HemW [Synergistaceae bacterium]|nr:radical SAM family heme chaperone HemW [Synergistota bacterium]NLM70875.1 radical SAM family heme chaperone HemW [Synergistaceae bacterium]